MTASSDPLALVGQSWDVWLSSQTNTRQANDGVSDNDEDHSIHISNQCSTVAGPSCRETVVACLPHLKAPCYGRCPSHDEFLLVHCKECGSRVKPISYNHHWNCRHVAKSKSKPDRIRSPPVVSVSSVSALSAKKDSNSIDPLSSARLRHLSTDSTPMPDDFESVLLSPRSDSAFVETSRMSRDSGDSLNIPPSQRHKTPPPSQPTTSDNEFKHLETRTNKNNKEKRAFARKTLQQKRTKLKEAANVLVKNHRIHASTSKTTPVTVPFPIKRETVKDESSDYVVKKTANSLNLVINKNVFDEKRKGSGIRIENQNERKNRRKQVFGVSPSEKNDIKVMDEQTTPPRGNIYEDQEFIPLGDQGKRISINNRLIQASRKSQSFKHNLSTRIKKDSETPSYSEVMAQAKRKLDNFDTKHEIVDFHVHPSTSSDISDDHSSIAVPQYTPWDTNNNHPKPITVNRFGARRYIRYRPRVDLGDSLTNQYVFGRHVDSYRRNVMNAMNLKPQSPPRPQMTVDDIYDELVRETAQFDLPDPRRRQPPVKTESAYDSASATLRELLSQGPVRSQHQPRSGAQFRTISRPESTNGRRGNCLAVKSGNVSRTERSPGTPIVAIASDTRLISTSSTTSHNYAKPVITNTTIERPTMTPTPPLGRLTDRTSSSSTPTPPMIINNNVSNCAPQKPLKFLIPNSPSDSLKTAIQNRKRPAPQRQNRAKKVKTAAPRLVGGPSSTTALVLSSTSSTQPSQSPSGAHVLAVTAQGNTAQIWCDFETGKFYQLNGQNGPGNGATALILPNSKHLLLPYTVQGESLFEKQVLLLVTKDAENGVLVARTGVKQPGTLLKSSPSTGGSQPIYVNIAPGPVKCTSQGGSIPSVVSSGPTVLRVPIAPVKKSSGSVSGASSGLMQTSGHRYLAQPTSTLIGGAP